MRVDTQRAREREGRKSTTSVVPKLTRHHMAGNKQRLIYGEGS